MGRSHCCRNEEAPGNRCMANEEAGPYTGDEGEACARRHWEVVGLGSAPVAYVDAAVAVSNQHAKGAEAALSPQGVVGVQEMLFYPRG